MRLFIAEKPSLARSIAAVLPKPQKSSKLYIEAGDDIVAWAAGHLLEQAPPDAYDPKYKRWSLDTLPIIPVPDKWQKVVKKDCQDLFNNLKELLKQADTVVNAGDCDREGQFLVDEILEYCHYKGRVLRILISDTNPEAVRKALDELQPNENFKGDSDAALARSLADWLLGMNASRLYNLRAQENGYRGSVLKIGRVKTPVTAIVVRRDEEIESFTPKPYWTIMAEIQATSGSFTASWRPKDEQAGLDEEGRLTDKAVGEELSARLKGQTATITKCESKKQSTKPPVGYSLPKLQMAASKKHDISPARTLEICQKLYEQGILTYPRSDCEYLPDAHQNDAEKVAAVIEKLSAFKRPKDFDVSRKTPVFNSKKVEEHHAIIPSASCKASEVLKGDEALIFNLVALRYLSFFMPDHEYLQANITAEIDGETFSVSGRQVVNDGWKALEKDEQEQDDTTKDTEEDSSSPLPAVSEGETCECKGVKLSEKKTKAPARFTEATLLKIMNEAHKVVSDPEIRKVLKETDGIGTAATQAGIIKELIDSGMLKKEKKYLISTPAARSLIKALPLEITLPDLTALWEMDFRRIKNGEITVDDMMKMVADKIRDMISNSQPIFIETPPDAKAAANKAPAKKKKAGKGDVKCPNCGGPMVLRNGKNGAFWGCANYPECKTTANDDNGKPVFRK